MSYDDYFSLQHLLFKFMRAFDDKDWLVMSDCLAKSVYCDYSSFRNEKPGKVRQDVYIKQRKERLANLKTQHNVSNALINSMGDFAEITCNYSIYRFHSQYKGAKKDYFHSHGQYLFQCKREKQIWLISSITQILLVNEGNPKLYGIT